MVSSITVFLNQVNQILLNLRFRRNTYRIVLMAMLNLNYDQYKVETAQPIISAITTPAACVTILRLSPSNFKESSKSFFTLGLFLTSSLNLGSLSMDS